MSEPCAAGWRSVHASLAQHPDDDPWKQAISAAPATDDQPHVDPASVCHKTMPLPVAMTKNWTDIRAMLHAQWRSHRQFELRVDPGMLVDTGTLVCEWQQTGIIPEKEEVETTLSWLSFDALGFNDFLVPAFQIAYDAFQTHKKGLTKEQLEDKDPVYNFKYSSPTGPSVSWTSCNNGMNIEVKMVMYKIQFIVHFVKMGTQSVIWVAPDRTVDKKRKRDDKDDKDDKDGV